MNDRITESDLLALVEGELPADRRAIVGEALRTNSELRARVEGMIRDAQALSQDRNDPPAAPSGVIARAMDEAEQPVGVVAPQSRRRLAMAAIITLTMVGVWGAILYATFGPDIGAGDPAKERPTRYMMIDEDQARHLATVLHPIEESINGTEFEGTETLGPLIADASGSDLQDIELDPEIEQMLTDFASLAGTRRSLAETAPRLAELLEQTTGAPAIEEIIAAAQDGRLRVILDDQPLPDLDTFIAGLPGGDWSARPTPIPVDDYEFARDYAKPAPGVEPSRPTKTDAEASAVRVDVALADSDDPDERDRAAARALNEMLISWAAPAPADGDAERPVRFVIEPAPIESEAREADDAWQRVLQNAGKVFAVFFECEAGPQVQ